ncbi:hypothetical protein [Paraburkholderia fungorum]|uniref:hypothetical protein n=1 Tax=Paraburkholderia fungorum TaxID=134537 RepID=UPI0038B95613
MARTLITPSTAEVTRLSSPGRPRVVPREVLLPIAPPRKRSKGVRHPTRLPLLMFAATLALMLVHQGGLVEFFYPLCAFGIALLFYCRSPAHYLGFVCWLMFLTPEVQHLADFVNGSSNAQSALLVTPLLAVALTGFTLLKHIALLGHHRAMPLMLIVIALLYAYVAGLAQVSPADATFALINWLYPVLVAFYLMVTWRHYPGYQRVLLKTLVYGGLLMSAYGVLEFVCPLPWDAFWRIAWKLVTAGQVPFGTRASSAMMGWPGTLLYATGIFMLLWRAFRASRLRSNDLLAVCGVGVALAILSMMMLVDTLNGLSGMLFFIGVTLPVISLRHARAHARHPSVSSASV